MNFKFRVFSFFILSIFLFNFNVFAVEDVPTPEVQEVTEQSMWSSEIQELNSANAINSVDYGSYYSGEDMGEKVFLSKLAGNYDNTDPDGYSPNYQCYSLYDLKLPAFDFYVNPECLTTYNIGTFIDSDTFNSVSSNIYSNHIYLDYFGQMNFKKGELIKIAFSISDYGNYTNYYGFGCNILGCTMVWANNDPNQKYREIIFRADKDIVGFNLQMNYRVNYSDYSPRLFYSFKPYANGEVYVPSTGIVSDHWKNSNVSDFGVVSFRVMNTFVPYISVQKVTEQPTGIIGYLDRILNVLTGEDNPIPPQQESEFEQELNEFSEINQNIDNLETQINSSIDSATSDISFDNADVSNYSGIVGGFGLISTIVNGFLNVFGEYTIIFTLPLIIGIILLLLGRGSSIVGKISRVSKSKSSSKGGKGE